LSDNSEKKGSYILSDQKNPDYTERLTEIMPQPIVKPSPVDRARVSQGVKRVLDAVRSENTDPEEQIKILMNALGLRIARSQYDNPEDVAKLSQGLVSYVIAYRTDSGDYNL
jgi:hypothetical protein